MCNVINERRFACSILSYDAKFLIAREVVVEIVEDFVVAKSLANVLSFEYFRAKIG